MNQPVSITPHGITITDFAQEKLKIYIDIEKEKRGCSELYLRLGVRSGGCSGFMYEIEFDTVKDDKDWHKDFGGVVIVVDRESLELLKGAIIDYEDRIQGSGIKIINPNEARSCGCGQSFS